MRSGNCQNRGEAEDALRHGGHSKLDVGDRSKVAVSHHLDAAFIGHTEKLFLGEVGVHLDLEHSWLDGGVAHNLTDHGGSDVADADATHKTFIGESLYSMVSLLVGDAVVDDHLGGASINSWVVVDPLGRVLRLNGHERHSDWEVNEIQV